MGPIRLSICIPTYNFGKFIGETLQSVITQATDGVEVVVVDGASSDDTPEVVHRFQQHFPRLIYHRREKNMGIDKDLEMTVELSQGDYCWLMSSDDLIRPGALLKMLSFTREENDVYVCGLISCDHLMNPLFQEPILPPDFDGVYDFNNEGQRKEYFSNALSLAAYFSFCSSLMFSRPKWNGVVLDGRFYGTCWGHVARIFGMMKNGLKVRYIHEPMLMKRGDNDSFLSRGAVNRVRIDIDGYNMIADTFWGKDSFEASHIRRVLRERTGLNHLFKLKMESVLKGELDNKRTMDRIVGMLYCDPVRSNIFKRLAYQYTPFVIYRLINKAYYPFKRFFNKVKPAEHINK